MYKSERMQEESLKILENVFISAGENRLQLCDIHFNEKIKKIIPKSDQLFDWKSIKEKAHKNNLVNHLPASEIKGGCSIDGAFLLAIPGAVDPHVHFNTPGFEFRDTFSEGSLAAAYGGVTTVIDMPCTSIPPVTTLANFKSKLSAVENTSHVDFAFWGGIAENGFDEKTIEKNIHELADAGVTGFKAYMISGMETFKDLNDKQMMNAAKYTGRIGKPLAVHAEDKRLINSAAGKCTPDELRTWQAYCNIRSIEAETEAVKKLIEIADTVLSKIHVVHLSSKAGLNLIKSAKGRGLSISTETCPHYLFFTQDSFNNVLIKNYLKTAPPVKFEADKEALWKGLAEGTIEFITTDHAGCDPEKEKSSSDFSQVYGGIPGVEHRVPFVFSEGFLNGKINLERAVRILSSNPADYFGLKGKGYIKEGYDADIALVNLWSSEIVSGSKMHSKGKYTPFEGVKFNAIVEKTILRGNLIADKLSSSDKTDTYYDKQYLGRFIYV